MLDFLSATSLGVVLLLAAWVAWWLWGVDWRRLWSFLAAGAWAPLVLLVVMIAAIWSWIAPSELAVLGTITVPSFWWQLLAVSLLVGVALFYGWLQTWLHWHPPEVELHPVQGDDHGHGHGHAHH